jgi:hypothetical protein
LENSGKLYTLFEWNNLKNCRLYDITKYDSINIFYSELIHEFNRCIQKGYNVYFYENIPVHNIIFTENDKNYLKLPKGVNYNKEIKYEFSENLKYIKEKQYLDFKWLLCRNKLDFLFCIPNLNEDNKYYYNFIIGFKNKDTINNMLEYKFNLIKIENTIYLNQMTLNEGILENFFKIKEYADNFVIFNDNNAGFDQSWRFKYNNEGLRTVKTGWESSIEEDIKDSLMKIKYHFYYNDDMINNMFFFTDLYNLSESMTIDENKNIVPKIEPYYSHFTDLVGYAEEIFYFEFWDIEKFHWTVKDFARDNMKFSREIFFQNLRDYNNIINRNKMRSLRESEIELLESFKKSMDFYKKRLKEYRKELKEYNKFMKNKGKKI